MVSEVGCSTQRDRHNQSKVNLWGLAWVASWLGVNMGVKYDWLPPGGFVIFGALLTTLLGIGMIQAYRFFLREADELKRKIELESLAFSVGVGLVGGITHSLLAQAGLISDWGVNVTVLLICFTYLICFFLGHRRYT